MPKDMRVIQSRTADELVETALILRDELGLSMTFEGAIAAVLQHSPTPEVEARVKALAANINELSEAGYHVRENNRGWFEWTKHDTLASQGMVWSKTRLGAWREAARHYIDN